MNKSDIIKAAELHLTHFIDKCMTQEIIHDDEVRGVVEWIFEHSPAAELLKQVEWQPIESAPKKEWCLVTAPNIPHDKVYIALFSEVNGCWWQDDLRTRVNAPTHWQPLPQPPVIIDKEGA